MLKENINFIIKGYDILKTIQNKLVEIKSQRLCNNNCINGVSTVNITNVVNIIEHNNITDSNGNNNKNNGNASSKPSECISNNACCINNINNKGIFAKIFSNMNFSFAIEFSMGNFM